MRRLRSFPAIVLAAYLVVAVFLFWSTWRSATHRWIGGEGDAEIIIWHLRWLPFALAHGHNPFASTYLDFPDGFNLMWNTSLLFPALVFSPVTALFGAVLAYDLLVTLALALSAWCAYFALTRYVRNRGAAAIGGLLYGFNPFIVAQAGGHAHLAIAAFPPLVLLLLDEILVRQRRSPLLLGVLLGVATAAQLLTGEELLALTVLVAAIGIVVLVALHRDRVRAQLPSAARALGIAAVVAIALSAYPLGFQFFGPQRVSGLIQPQNRFVVDALEFVVPTSQQQITTGGANHISAKFAGGEHGAYIGIPLLVLLVLAAIRYRRVPLVRFVAALAIVTAILSLGPRLHVAGHSLAVPLPWDVVQRVPLFENALPARVTLLTFLLLGWLLAVAIDRFGPRIGIATALVALIPLGPNLPYAWTPSASPSFFTSKDVRRVPEGSVALVLPFARGLSSARPMVWQADAGMRYRQPEGYVLVPGPTFDPPTIARYGSKLFTSLLEINQGASVLPAGRERDTVACELSSFHIKSVIVGPGTPNAPATSAFFRELFGRGPTVVGGVQLWTSVPQSSTERCPRTRLANGWHELESGGPYATFHWMKTLATLTVGERDVRRPLLELTFAAESFAIPRELTFAIDDTPIARTNLPAGKWMRVKVTLPAATGRTKIQLETNPGAQTAGRNDKRPVSVAVSDISVTSSLTP